jgi:hypothetical protein
VLALIKAMSPTELTTNAKLLGKMGVNDSPALRGAFEEGLAKAARSKKTTLKASRAAEAVTDVKLKKKLEALQERQIDSIKGIEGDWLVLADKSGSMSECIRVAVEVSATLARFVKGQVRLVFFNTSPQHIDVTGLSLVEIRKRTQYISASGGTSIGCGMRWAADQGANVDGIAIVSDMHENTGPLFADEYAAYCRRFSKDPTVYLYTVGTNEAWQFAYRGSTFQENLRRNKIDAQEFKLGATVDYYSLPNLVQTMRTNRYSLIDEIMGTPLLRLEEVLKKRAA